MTAGSIQGRSVGSRLFEVKYCFTVLRSWVFLPYIGLGGDVLSCKVGIYLPLPLHCPTLLWPSEPYLRKVLLCNISTFCHLFLHASCEMLQSRTLQSRNLVKFYFATPTFCHSATYFCMNHVKCCKVGLYVQYRPAL